MEFVCSFLFSLYFVPASDGTTSSQQAVAVEITVVHNFLWHERFTWADRMTSTPLRRFVAFNLSNGAISLLGNIGLMNLLLGVFGVNYLVANVFSIAACSLLNFAVGDRLVFAPQCTDR